MNLETIEFSSKIEKYTGLSNFYNSPFTIDGLQYTTVEHYFQEQKFPTDPDLQSKIRNAPTPQKAKLLGKTKTAHFREDWESVKEEIMLKALLAKFNQNPVLSDLLKSTNNAILKEKSPWDSYWGIGRYGKGKNRLGILLMEVRSNKHQK